MEGSARAPAFARICGQPSRAVSGAAGGCQCSDKMSKSMGVGRERAGLVPAGRAKSQGRPGEGTRPTVMAAPVSKRRFYMYRLTNSVA
jgi:hypothetical protein